MVCRESWVTGQSLQENDTIGPFQQALSIAG